VVQPVFQDPIASLNPRWRIQEIIGLPLAVQGVGSRADRREAVAALMEKVGLPASLAGRLPRALSGGQRQRVAIARALIGGPEVLVCDEPTSALDVSVQAQILNLLQDLQRDLALGFVLISHNLAVVEHIADRVMIMYLGRVVEEGPARQTLLAPRHPYTAKLRRAVLSPIPGQGLPADETDDLFPDPHDPPPGCAFHPRCGRRSARCVIDDPALTALGPGAVACHHPLPAPPADFAEERTA
jgi:peptide/nickel transport system ATP-binding protein